MYSMFLFQNSGKYLKINLYWLLWIISEIVYSTNLAAWIPSHVEANLIKIRSLAIPTFSYILMYLIALAILASLSKDNLK